MASHAAAEQEARQPLLFSADHGHHRDNQDLLDNIQPDSQPGHDKDMENWHWLEKLVFKTRHRFAVSLCTLIVFCTLIVSVDRSQVPWSDLQWPWNHQPQRSVLRENQDFQAATSRLSEQPFCLPSVSRYKPLDIDPAYAGSRGRRWAGQALFESVGAHRPTWGSDCPDGHVSQPMHCVIYRSVSEAFDRLAGSSMREAARRQRDKVQVLVSIAEGDPIYMRTTISRSISPAHSNPNTNESGAFRSVALWATLQSLSEAATREFGKHVAPEQLLAGMELNHTRVITVPELSIEASHRGPSKVLETTLPDAQRFVQSLVAIYNGLLETSETLPLNSTIIGHLFRPVMLSTDGSTSTTRSPFDLVRNHLAGRGFSALRGVGGDNLSGLRLQRRPTSLDLLVLNEVIGEHELSITMNLERGIVATALADLGMGTLYNEPSNRFSHQKEAQANRPTSLWDWMQSWFVNIVYDLDWGQESRMNKDVSGTYRYERNLQHNSRPTPAAQDLEWLEVDVRFEERSLWLTRIEYRLASNGSFPQAADANTRASSVSVLPKYNVGGTADFFGGWTCRSNHVAESLAECYRPIKGDDDSRCYCKDGLTSTYSSYRVGLWPTRTSPKEDTYQIPQGAIRRDGNSYMDQGVGGCPALWRPDREQSVSEMDLLGYKLKLIEPQPETQGKVNRDVGIEWLNAGLIMERVVQV